MEIVTKPKSLKDLPIEEWPEIDGYDCLPPREPMSPEYIQSILPDHIKAALAAKKATKESAS
jgi:hypothetical protein